MFQIWNLPAQVQLKSNGVVDFYATIQGAINASGSNDSIFIPDGVWYESIQFDATGISTVYIGGESKENTIISAADPLFLDPQPNTWQELNNGIYSCYHPLGITASDYPIAADGDDSLLFTYSNWASFVSFHAEEGIFYNHVTDSLYIKINGNPNEQPLKISSSISPFYIKNSVGWSLTNFTVELGARAGMFLRETTEDLTMWDIRIVNNRNGILAWGAGNDWNLSDLHIKNYHSPRWSWHEIKHPPFNGNKTMETSGIKFDLVTNLDLHHSEIDGFFDGFVLFNDDPLLAVNLKFYNNKLHNIFDDALCFEGVGAGTEIYKNRIYNSFVGISLFPYKGTSESPIAIYRNAIVNNKAILWQDTLGTPEYIHGNTFKIGETNTGEVEYLNIYQNSFVGYSGIVKLLGNSTGPWAHCNFINNIFYGFDKSPIYDTGLAEDFNFFDGNLYYRETSGSIIKRWNSLTLEYYQTLQDAVSSIDGLEAHWEGSGLDVNPEFISADLSPNTSVEPQLVVDLTSPIINAGIDLPNGFMDCVSINDNEPDIGHIEYSSLGIPNEETETGDFVEWKNTGNAIYCKVPDYSGELSFYLMDISGKKNKYRTINYQANTWSIFDIAYLQSGYYILVLVGSDGTVMSNYRFIQ